jgi:hypothetical protein
MQLRVQTAAIQRSRTNGANTEFLRGGGEARSFGANNSNASTKLVKKVHSTGNQTVVKRECEPKPS